GGGMSPDIMPGRSVPSTLDSLASSTTDHPRWIWRNGELVPWQDAMVHVNSVGHASVAAIFEGIKAYRADQGNRLLAFRLDEHLKRLYRSARLCRVHLPIPWDALRDAIIELLRANGYREDAYVRPWAFPAGVIREQMVTAGA